MTQTVELPASASASRRRQRRRFNSTTALIFICFLGTAVLRPKLGAGLFPVDVALVLLAAKGLSGIMNARNSPGAALLRKLTPWIWVIFCGSLLALLDDGLPTWALVSLLKTLFALAFFVSALHVLEKYGLHDVALKATYGGIGVTLFALLFVRDYYDRPRAFFLHPNYAAHYLAVAGAVAFFYGSKSRIRLAAVAACLFGIYLTASFGAIVMVAVGAVAYFFITRPKGWIFILLAVTLPTAVYVNRNFASDGVDVNEGISSQRFERSQDGRQVIWSNMLKAWEKDPLGYGPDGTAKKNVAGEIGGELGLESHNDWLAYLCERGPIGLIGIIGFWWVLWRFAPRRSGSRVILLAAAAASFLRETMNYRHLWLLLALAISLDRIARARGDRQRVRAEALW